MADFSKAQPKKKKAGRFGTPPSPEQASNNLDQPEHAPVHPAASEAPKKKPVKKKTIRSVPLGLKVSEKFSREFKKTAVEDGLKLVELLEASLEAYKQNRRKR
jgi:hypothetical protein